MGTDVYGVRANEDGPASGTELAYRRIGDDAPLVIIPGGPRFALAHLRPTLDALANGREVVCVDERRSGSSGR